MDWEGEGRRERVGGDGGFLEASPEDSSCSEEKQR